MNTIICYVVVGIVAAFIYVKGVREDSPVSSPEPQEEVSKPKKRKYATVRSYRRLVAS